MTFGAHYRLRRLSCLLALVWALLPLGSAAPCVRALPKAQPAAAPSLRQAAPRCPMCAMGTPMPGMSCCRSHGSQPSCRCGIQPSPKPDAVLAALVWSPHAVLPAPVSVLPPRYFACVYPAVSARLLTLARSPLPRPPRFL